MTKLWKVERLVLVNSPDDGYNEMIVAAETEQKARETHPNSYLASWEESKKIDNDDPWWSSLWVSHPEQTKATLWGESIKPIASQTVIVAKYSKIK